MYQTRMQVISKIKMHLFKQWKLFFSGLIIFWLFIMVTFSVGLISRNSNPQIYLNHRKLHDGRINYHIHGSFDTKKIHHPDSGDSHPFTNNNKNGKNSSAINSNDPVIVVSYQNANLTTNGSESNQNKSERLNKLSDEDSIGSDLLRGITSKGGRDDGSFLFPSLNRRHKPVIADLPRDKISENQINDIKNKFLPKLLSEETRQSKNVSNQNISIYEKLGNSALAAKDQVLPNHTLLQKNLRLNSTPYIKSDHINQPLLNSENHFANPQNEKAVINSQSAQAYRPQGNLLNKLPLQQPAENRALQDQKEKAYNRVNPIIGGANQKIDNKDPSINANYQRNQILQDQNGSNDRGLPGLLSTNITVLKKDILKDLLAELLKYQKIRHQRDVPYNSQKGALSLQNNPSLRQQPVKMPFFKSRLLPKLNGYESNKLPGVKDTMPKYGAYQNQGRAFVDRLAGQAVPNNLPNSELQRNTLQKQPYHVDSRQTSNVLPQDRLVLQKQPGGDSFNRRLAQPESAHLDANMKANVERVLGDNANYQHAAQVGEQKQGIEHVVVGSHNKAPFEPNIARLVDRKKTV